MKEPLTFHHKMRSNKEKCFASEWKYHHNNNFSHFSLSRQTFLPRNEKIFLFEAKKLFVTFALRVVTQEKLKRERRKREVYQFCCQKDIVFLFHLSLRITVQK